MSTTEADVQRELLDLRKTREEIASDLARRHHGQEQERFWRFQARYLSILGGVAVVGGIATIVTAIGATVRLLAGP